MRRPTEQGTTRPSLIGTTDLAEILGVSAHRVRRLADAGRPQATQVGRSLAFFRNAAEEFAAQERATGRPRKR